MFTFLYNAVRVFAYSLLGLTVVAAGIGRMNPPPPIRRMPRPALRVELEDWRKPSAWKLEYRLRDPATGRLEHFTAPGGDRLNNASCSPWRDSEDRSQLVAQWVSFEGRGSGMIPSGSGIARYSLPEGELMDRVQLESPATSPPCWYPGTEARILFPAGDGWLYHYNFDEPDDEPGNDGANRPRPLAWPDRPQGLEKIVFFHATWPEDPRLKGRLIVGLSRIEVSGKGSRFTTPKIWWLQLDPGGTTVQAAGRLTGPCEDDAVIQETHPQVTTTPDGRLMLSYTVAPPGTPEGRPRLVPIAFDPATDAPFALETASDAPAEDCPPMASGRSAIGRQVAQSRGGLAR